MFLFIHQNNHTLMKKVFVSLAILATFAMGACKNKAENPSPTIGKATIAGFATVDLDLSQAGNQGSVPAGTKITVVVNTQDLVVTPVSGANYARKVYEGVIGADGSFSIEIDAIAKPFTAAIYPNNFEAQQTPIGGPPSVRKTFAVNNNNPINVTIAQGQRVVREFTYIAQ